MTNDRKITTPRKEFWVGGALGLSIGLGGLFLGTMPALGTAESTGQTVTPVFGAELPNLPGNSLTAVLVEYAPGAGSTGHRHAGSVFAYVIDGAVRSKLDDGAEVVYQAGESFFEPPGTHHAVSENASETEPASLLAIIVAENGATLTTFDE